MLRKVRLKQTQDNNFGDVSFIERTAAPPSVTLCSRKLKPSPVSLKDNVKSFCLLLSGGMGLGGLEHRGAHRSKGQSNTVGSAVAGGR